MSAEGRLAGPRVREALAQAERSAAAAAAPPTPARPSGSSPRSVTRHVAIGDPQAPIERFFTILDLHGLLGDDGWLAPDVHLVAIGDYFDWGGRDDRERAAKGGRELLEWLAAHPRQQATVLLGNHDLARVGELVGFSDASFVRARAEADAAYFDQRPERPVAAFAEETGLPGWEIAARDFSTFEVAQRDTVTRLLQEERVDVAFASGSDLLLTHAGVTGKELTALGLATTVADAPTIATALNARFKQAVHTWLTSPGRPLAIPGLHEPGDRTREGRGMFYHRPEVRAPGDADDATGRRYDVASLPIGLSQAIGHIRDKKRRTLLRAPGDVAEEGGEGALYFSEVSGGTATYARGVPARAAQGRATLIFLDGGMREVAPEHYELFDLGARDRQVGTP